MNKNEQILWKIFQALDCFFDPLGWYPGDSPIEKVIGMILVQNTSFTTVRYSIDNLKDCLSIEAMLHLPLEELQEKINPSGFYVQKSLAIREVLTLIDSYGGFEEIKNVHPASFRNRLVSIKGIGNETADVILLYLAQDKRFISDAYARRILGRCLGMEFKHYNDMPQIREYYIKRLSIGQLQQFHAMIDELGGRICRKKPRCSLCPLKADCLFHNVGG
ncbi:hypothetical protein BU202_08700 [Streptococcus cuniculi]|uniref:HhH-GPD domain-containing protein n=1 Tax=Streptococcus cuniculi TaxID=1432788 RepID=A0A1Q8E5T6_9STRE|nr:hypothetical protein [Streptococcus cuniculi]OLF47151.1 hypothetical protein BU202_08700 [Streptococcus cuniculi]